MKILIDISEESYKATCNGCMLPPDVENVVQGIKNGKPLLKDHEKTIDAIDFAIKATDTQDVIAWMSLPEPYSESEG